MLARSEHRAYLSIGQVLARLTPDFPELTPSKLRFLEERGLIRPARTASGYRKFCAADLERIRTILLLQRDQYLPLKVIRGYLDDLDAGKNPALPGGGSGTTILTGGRRLSREEIVEKAGATTRLLDDAVSAALLNPGDGYDDEALRILRALVDLRQVGIEPRHLRGLRASAEREGALIGSALTPLLARQDFSSRGAAADRAIEIAGHLGVVRASLVRSAVSRLGQQ